MKGFLKKFSKPQVKTFHKSPYVLRNPLFDKILIANRGEIACRVIKTCKKLGIKTVAVYSEADAKSKHVSLADEAYLIGPPEAKHSYLLGEKILEVAKRSGAQAIHPGYGFLSENAGFSELCHKNGVVFIGPPAGAIIAMGSKSESKKIMSDAKVPIIPGYHGEAQDEKTLLKEAEKMGFPLLIKAVHGGGGKGMKIVTEKENFLEQLASAKREAKNFFGNDHVLIERYLTKPRHIEFQVFADTHGNVVYLFERDCSVQRRHQKIIEEAPAPGLSQLTREQMGTAAVNAARAVGYVGAGTVEFIVDEDNTFYFMEMNTRLQVEHPVSEMITGQDLVEWQIQVASGNKLPLEQKDLKINGHSFEARIYSENPKNNFLPTTGQLKYLKPPPEIENYVRVESGVRQGDEVSIFYDPMIAKLVVWGKDRDEALKRLKLNLDDYQIVGLPNNIEFLKNVCVHPEFRKGNVFTNFIPKHFDQLFPKEVIDVKAYIFASIGVFLTQVKQYQNDSSPWSTLTGFRVNDHLKRTISFLEDKKKVDIILRDDAFEVIVNGDAYAVTATFNSETNELVAFVDNVKHISNVVILDSSVTVFTNGTKYELTTDVLKIGMDGHDSAGSLKSPMPGKIIQVPIKVGDHIQKGKTLIIMEAMKMEHVIKAPYDGVVKKIFFKPGDMVQKSTNLVELEESK